MGRTPRVAAGGYVYHALNRAIARTSLFEQDGDYDAFEQVICEVCHLIPMRILDYCLMPTHWHLVVWPSADGDLSLFLHRLTLTHTRRWHTYRECVGRGHLYQDRFKSILVEEDEHLITVCRYVERNPVRAGLVQRAEDWRWASLWHRLRKRPDLAPPLAEWPVVRPANWLDLVNTPLTSAELDDLRKCIERGRPFGSYAWANAAVSRFGLQSAVRRPGRPRRSP